MSRGLDTGRMSAAVSRPGIDPRVWLTLAHVTAVGFDPKEGCFADLVLQPSGVTETAYFGTGYAGAGFGEHSPLEIDDTVMVGIPMGEAGFGPVILARFNNAGDPPHADFGEGSVPSGHRVTRVKAGRNLVLRVSGGGQVLIEDEAQGGLVCSSAAGDVRVQAGQAVNVIAGAAIGLAATAGVTIAPGAGGPGIGAAPGGGSLDLGGPDGGPAIDAATLATPTMADLQLLRADILALMGFTAAAFGAVTAPGGGPVAQGIFAGAPAVVGVIPLAPVAATKVRIV